MKSETIVSAEFHFSYDCRRASSCSLAHKWILWCATFSRHFMHTKNKCHQFDYIFHEWKKRGRFFFIISFCAKNIRYWIRSEQSTIWRMVISFCRRMTTYKFHYIRIGKYNLFLVNRWNQNYATIQIHKMCISLRLRWSFRNWSFMFFVCVLVLFSSWFALSLSQPNSIHSNIKEYA